MISLMRAWAQGQEHVILCNSESQTDEPVLLLFLFSAESDCGATCAAKDHTTAGSLSVCFIWLQTSVPSEYD